MEQLRSQRFILSAYRPEIALKITGAQGEVSLNESIYTPILDLMSDYKIRTFEQVEQSIKDKGVNFAQLNQALLVLCGLGHISAVQDEALIAKTKKATDKLNSHLMNKARSSNDISFLASPVTAGGVGARRFLQLFLMSLREGKKKPEEWAADVWRILTIQGQKIVKEGKTLETPEENLAELQAQAVIFAEKQLPILKALQIA